MSLTAMNTQLRFWLNKQLRFSPYFYQKLKAVQQESKLSFSELECLRNKRFLKLVNQAYSKSSFYRDLYDQHGVNLQQIQNTEDIHKLPIITKYDLQAHITKMFVGNRFNQTQAYTSGTSGPPLRVYRDYQSTILEGAYHWRQKISFGHYPGMKTVVLRANLHRDKRESYDPFTQSLFLSSYQLSEKNGPWYYEKISQFAPHAIYAYPSSMESLANIFSAIGKSVSVPFVFTSSETLYQHQRSKVERVFNTCTVDWYGNAERSIALEQKSDGKYHELPLYSVNEYYDEYTVATGLINFSLPLIRYRVDDIISLDKTSPTTASGCRQIATIQGRSDDVLLLPDGSRIGMIWGVFDRIPNLLRAQVIQKQLEKFQVNLVVGPEFGLQDEKLLRTKIAEFIGEQANYTLSYVSDDQIVRAKSGKYKLIINDLLCKEPETSDSVTT